MIKPTSLSNMGGIQNRISQSAQSLGDSFAKLASGQRINKAADDAAGLAISEQLKSQISSMDQATNNIGAGSSLLRTAEGGMGQIGDLLVRGRELAMQAANGTMNDQQRQTVNNEFGSIKSEINRITQTTEFNGQQLLTGQLGPNAQTPLTIQAGIKNSPADQISINTIQAMDTNSLGIHANTVDTAANAAASLQNIDKAISMVSQNRSEVGALENRFNAGAQNLSVAKENLMAADAQIRGLDYASEVSAKAKNDLLLQAGVSALKSGLKANEKSIGSLLNIKG